MGRYRLVSVKVKGFRGFPEQARFTEFKFDQPCTLLFGAQGGGKSSTVTAVAWCLFGDKVANARDTGIQERKHWLVKNKNSTEASVEVTLEGDGEILKVFRHDGKRRGQPAFYYHHPDGSVQEDEPGLRVLLGVELADYMSCVHLHQEVINALLVDAPEARKDALDRLMGLENLRNLLDGVTRARVGNELRAIDDQFGSIEQTLMVEMRVKRGDLKQAVEEAKLLGIPEEELSLPGAKTRCECIAEEIRAFAKDFGIPASLLAEPQTVRDLSVFANSAQAAIRCLRDRQPDLKRQTELLKREGGLNRKKADYEGTRTDLRSAQAKLDVLRNERGERATAEARSKEIEERLLPGAKERFKAMNNRAGVIREALRFLDLSKGDVPDKCPVCERPINAARVRRHLEDWQEEMKSALGPIQGEIDGLESEHQALATLIGKFIRAEVEIRESAEGVKTARNAIGTILQREMAEGEDPLVLLEQERGRVDRDLIAIHDVVEQSNKRLNKLADELEDIKRIFNVLNVQRIIEELASIKQSPEFKEVKEARQAAHTFGDTVATLEEAIQEVLRATAATKISSTKAAISAIYRKLTQRSDFPDLAIDPEKYEVMVVGPDGEEIALRILNQGDINCAALSIFLALAGSADLTHNLGFIVLDDPSQSLDAQHKERLTYLLDELLKEKQLIIATSETDFARHLCGKLTKNKRTYVLEGWAEDTGPHVKLE